MSQFNYIDKHKMFWHLNELQAVLKNELIAPVYLEVSPVSHCNHDCIFCATDYARIGHITLDPEKLSLFLKDGYKAGIKSVMFAGEGEPLLHPKIETLVTSAKEACLDVSITTNGSILLLKRWETILPQLSWLRFSVNGTTPDSHRSIHKSGKNDFNNVMSNIREVVSLKRLRSLKTTIGIQVVVLKENIVELESAAEKFSQLGVDYVSFKPFSANPKMLHKLDCNYSNAELEIIERLDKIKSIGGTEIACRKSAFMAQDKELSFDHCHAISLWGYIHSNGDFYTCSNHIGDKRFIVGNINHQNVNDILFGTSRKTSVSFAKHTLDTKLSCRVNCRMARINEFIKNLQETPPHVNFI